MRKFLKFLKDDRGASAVEYGLLVAMVTAVIVGAEGGVFEDSKGGGSEDLEGKEGRMANSLFLAGVVHL